MALSKTIAGLVGPTLVAIAAGLLLNLSSLPLLIESVARDPALIYVSGVLAFVAGLAIVRVHNRWTADWAVLVTIFGWLAFIGGLFRMLLPFWLADMATGLAAHSGVLVSEAVVFLAAGAFLSLKAYSRA